MVIGNMPLAATLLALVGLCCSCGAGSAGDRIGNDRNIIAVADYKLLIDSSFARSPESVFAELMNGPQFPFSPHANFGYISQPVWVLVNSRNYPENMLYRIKHSLIDSVEVYLGDTLGLTHYASCGLLQPKKEPALQDVYPCFIVPRELGSKNILIKIRSSDVCVVEIETLTAPAFIERSRSTYSLFGLYFGAVIILALINFFLFISAKYTSSLWYSIYIIMFATFQAFALGIMDLHTVFNCPAILKNATPVFACICISSGSLFTADFLALAGAGALFKPFTIAFRVFVNFGLAVALLGIAGYGPLASKIISFFAPGFLVMSLAVGILRIRSLGRPAVFYAVAMAVLAAGIIANSLRNFGIIQNSFLAAHGNIIGSAFEFIIIAIALVDRFSTIEHKKNEAFREVQYAKRLVSESRLKALQAQINPHFLFNTLNTLAELVKIFPEKAEKLVVSLSRFFRYTLTASDNKMAVLGEEIEMVRTYLSIEKMRFGDRLEYALTVDGAVGDVSIPALVIQPIVENSIKHGIAQQPGGGTVSITCAVAGDVVRISIRDSGPGFDAAARHGGAAHGLQNVRERLRLLYGDEAHLHCKNMNGALIELILPTRGNEPASGIRESGIGNSSG